eukprot:gnl/MRDRNA2_/MRDRNA2_73795_c0_seq1.p1 gnl/MRDRNA2_/MRDRNA2_73795_c0~~gnl/MRDRNA2_/MRDRNA2_73795_c0_seq1.p1  ORF type:complete len:245 (-),score=37.51 gnl/MRDRNA2_/MRDRNA2_73795_c0_seq1:466-1200(-)
MMQMVWVLLTIFATPLFVNAHITFEGDHKHPALELKINTYEGPGCSGPESEVEWIIGRGDNHLCVELKHVNLFTYFQCDLNGGDKMRWTLHLPAAEDAMATGSLGPCGNKEEEDDGWVSLEEMKKLADGECAFFGPDTHSSEVYSEGKGISLKLDQEWPDEMKPHCIYNGDIIQFALTCAGAALVFICCVSVCICYCCKCFCFQKKYEAKVEVQPVEVQQPTPVKAQEPTIHVQPASAQPQVDQ